MITYTIGTSRVTQKVDAWGGLNAEIIRAKDLSFLVGGRWGGDTCYPRNLIPALAQRNFLFSGPIQEGFSLRSAVLFRGRVDRPDTPVPPSSRCAPPFRQRE
jgi:hypothetical protein